MCLRNTSKNILKSEQNLPISIKEHKSDILNKR